MSAPVAGAAEIWRDDLAGLPAFAHLAPWLDALRGTDWPDPARLDRLAKVAGVVNAAGFPIRFEAQTGALGQRDYEARILASGRVPSRSRNWHDFLNALCWLTFPRAKAALNRYQCAALADGARGPASDAATLFDESGLILVGLDAGLVAALADHDWRAALVERRAAWRHARAYAIGHAVLEKLLRPWPGITAKCLALDLPGEVTLATVDEAVAEIWSAGGIGRPAELFPLPVLGIPGWWPANADPAFYDDVSVFRPARGRPS